MAVGDSFTYGEYVGDLDAWPAQLQRLTGRSGLNGGVSGYGLDQIVVRAERLMALHGSALAFEAECLGHPQVEAVHMREISATR